MKLMPRGVTEPMLVHRWTWTSGGAFCGLCFGDICPIIGSIFYSNRVVHRSGWHGFLYTARRHVLLFLTIPLLIFGAHLSRSDGQAG